MSAEWIIKGLTYEREKAQRKFDMSNDNFKYPTNDKNSDPGVKLNNC